MRSATTSVCASAASTAAPLECTTTIGSGLASAIQGAAAGTTICLNAGSYGNLTLTNYGRADYVTIRPVQGATVTVGEMWLNNVDHLKFDGQGGTLLLGELELDPSDGPNWSDHLTFQYAKFVGPLQIRVGGVNAALLFDHLNLDNLGPGTWNGRVGVRGYNNTEPVGVTISNSSFRGGCSDGVMVIGAAYGVQIGPGNEFTGIVEGGCGFHADPIQLFGSRHTLITGNYFHDNGDGSGGVMAPDGGVSEQIVNNVFVVDEYPLPLQLGSHDNGLVAHNTFIGGQIDCASHKPEDPPSSGQVCRDNVYTGTMRQLDPGNSEHHNLCRVGDTNCAHPTDIKATPVFVGGRNPSSYEGYRLAPGSPGKGAASDGSDIGIRVPG
jgi:hypothetical protein